MAKPLRFPHKKLIAFDDETIAGVEAWRKEQSPIPSEPEAIRRILKNWFEQEQSALNLLYAIDKNVEGGLPAQAIRDMICDWFIDRGILPRDSDDRPDD